MTTHTVDYTDPLMSSRTLVARAAGYGNDALEFRRAGNHQQAGVLRELERAALKRAEVLALIDAAEGLDRVAQAIERLGLAR